MQRGEGAVDETVSVVVTHGPTFDWIEPWILSARNKVVAQVMSTVEEYLESGDPSHRKIRRSLIDATEVQMNEYQVRYTGAVNNGLLSKSDGAES